MLRQLLLDVPVCCLQSLLSFLELHFLCYAWDASALNCGSLWKTSEELVVVLEEPFLDWYHFYRLRAHIVFVENEVVLADVLE